MSIGPENTPQQIAARDDLERAIQAYSDAISEGDLVTAWSLVIKTTVATDADATGYIPAWRGALDEHLGLLRYATLKAEGIVLAE